MKEETKRREIQIDLLRLPRGVGAGLGEDELPLRPGDHPGAPRVGRQLRRHVHVHRQNHLGQREAPGNLVICYNRDMYLLLLIFHCSF